MANSPFFDQLKASVSVSPKRSFKLPDALGGRTVFFKTTSVADQEHAIGIVGPNASALRSCIALFVTKSLGKDGRRLFGPDPESENEAVEEMVGWPCADFFVRLSNEMATSPYTVDDAKNASPETLPSGSGSSSHAS
jgi:hypothetical protein